MSERHFSLVILLHVDRSEKIIFLRKSFRFTFCTSEKYSLICTTPAFVGMQFKCSFARATWFGTKTIFPTLLAEYCSLSLECQVCFCFSYGSKSICRKCLVVDFFINDLSTQNLEFEQIGGKLMFLVWLRKGSSNCKIEDDFTCIFTVLLDDSGLWIVSVQIFFIHPLLKLQPRNRTKAVCFVRLPPFHRATKKRSCKFFC